MGKLQEIVSDSDIQTGIYEGGFKVWECSIDLVEYMKQHLQTLDLTSVLELGCGHGLPGIFALKNGATNVVFNDYNAQVITLATTMNVQLNVNSSLLSQATFYSGDWAQVSETFVLPVASLLLTAETIYTEAVAVQLFEVIKTLLIYCL